MLQDKDIIEPKLRQSCFNIAERVCSVESNWSIEESISELELLFEHSEKYYKYALLECIELSENQVDPEVIFPALSYIEKHFAIPAMINDPTWFADVLNTLLSFFTDDKNIIEDKNSYEFLIQLAKKLSQRIQNG